MKTKILSLLIIFGIILGIESNLKPKSGNGIYKKNKCTKCSRRKVKK